MKDQAGFIRDLEEILEILSWPNPDRPIVSTLSAYIAELKEEGKSYKSFRVCECCGTSKMHICKDNHHYEYNVDSQACTDCGEFTMYPATFSAARWRESRNET